VKTEDGNVSKLIISNRETEILEDVRPKGDKMENNQTELRDLRHVDILERPPKILSLRGRDLAAPKKFTREILRSHETDKKTRFI